METFQLSPTDYLICGVMFMLGQGVHIFWSKIPSFKKLARAANKRFSYSEWWSCDRDLVIGLNLIGASLFLGIDQLIGFAPDWIDKLKWFFWLFGTFGSTIGFRFYSRYDQGTVKLLDLKSNLADTITGGTTTVQDTIDKGMEMTGKDISKAPNQ
jgi:hypothetical protein